MSTPNHGSASGVNTSFGVRGRHIVKFSALVLHVFTNSSQPPSLDSPITVRINEPRIITTAWGRGGV